MKKNTNMIYGCEIAHGEFSLSTELWLRKSGFNSPILVPVRRNCMTGSGFANQCHSNVLNLVTIYGGHRLGGYLVTNAVDELGNNITIFFSHSVWVTPEGKAVDVTAHNFTDDRSVVFIPKFKETKNSNILADFVLPKSINKDGVWVNFDEEFNAIFSQNENLELIRFGDSLSFVRFPSSKFSHKLLHVKVVNKTAEDWALDLLDGGFTQDSRWSKRSWKEIKTSNLSIC